jgi:hypothetical protein
MIADPPVDAGAVNKTDPWPSPAMVLPMTGAPGTVAGTTATLLETAPVPAAFVAVTAQV